MKYTFQIDEDIKINRGLDDRLDSMAYMFSAQKYANIMDSYYKLYVKPKPKYLPMFIYKFIMKKLLNMVKFKKN